MQNDLVTNYQRLIQKEAQLIDELAVCEDYIEAMLDITQKNGSRLRLSIIEDIVNAVYKIESDRRQHLLDIRVELAIVGCEMKNSSEEKIKASVT
ncbi:hypothetical protein [Paenibacillus kobensis]|uniref:hypothetical protein n=1 Tax=Paenibacillus kobensis TaxID=59841 RepID=UPI000FDA1DF0|nr:hypothetical protein [Paenibacillus kobensis]